MRKLDYRPQVHQSGTREQFVTSNQKDSYHKLDLRLFWIESVLLGAAFGQNFKYSALPWRPEFHDPVGREAGDRIYDIHSSGGLSLYQSVYFF